MLDWLIAAILMTVPAPQVASPLPADRKADIVAVIPITGPIDSITTASLRRRLDQADALGADAVVLELNTPGGSLMATLEITNLIRTEAPTNTVAWVRPFAFSAGTVIALSAREIVTSPDAMFGDAAPITALGPMPATERAKVESPLLAEVIDSARRQRYDEQLVQAFVSVGIELWMLKQRDGRAVVFVNRQEYESIYGHPPPESLPAIAPPDDGTEVEVHPLLTMLAGMDPDATQETTAFDAQPTVAAPPRPVLTSADANAYELIGQVVPNDRLLTLKPWQAQLYGLSRSVVADDEAMRQWMGATKLIRIESSWSESLVQVLVSWPIRTALVAILVICVLIEMAIPGTGWFGIGAVLALAGLIGAPMLIGLAQWWDVAAVGVGLILIAVEVLLVPGTIIAGVLGAGLVLFGLVGSAVTGDLASDETQTQFVQGGIVVLVGAAIGLSLGALLLRRLGGIKTGPLVLNEEVGQDPSRDHPVQSPAIGSPGITVTDLRPSGRVRVNGHVIDAVCSGRWIEAGMAIRVVKTGIVCQVEPIDT